MPEPESIQASLNAISDFILRYAVTLAALAALTVGLLEAYKKVFSTLARFQQKAVIRWLEQEASPGHRATQLSATLMAGGHYGIAATERAGADVLRRQYDAQQALADVLHLTTGVSADVAQGLARNLDASAGGPMARNIGTALFELDLAMMMSQIQEAADAALNNPERYPNWFGFLTRGCPDEDVRDWMAAMGAGSVPENSTDIASTLQRQETAQVYARIRLLMRRQLDSFQTVTAFRWKEWNQFWAWLVGFVLLMLAQLIQANQAGTTLTPSGWLVMIVVSLAGGILAPVAKDLVDALGKVKTGG